MIRTFRYPLRPTEAQEGVLRSWLGFCCDLYNAALEHRVGAWRKQRVAIQYRDQQAELTQLRAVDGDSRAVPAWVARSPLMRLDRAYRAFFQRVKCGEKPGFPRFRSRDRYDSFDLGTNSTRIEEDRVFLPKLGPVKFHKYREMRGVVRQVRVNRTARGWTVSFVCDVGAAPSRVASAPRSSVGVDVGLSSLAVLSTGERIDNPRFFRASEDVLARRQQSLARKVRGSSSRQRARRLVARAHDHIRNQRLDFARKLACTLFSRFDLVAFEDLNTKGLASSFLSKSVNDAGWSILRRCLTSKAEEAGKWAVAVDPCGTTIDCSVCGDAAPKTLGERVHRCSKCGLVIDRDENAAINILARGLRAVPATEASGGSREL